MQPDETDASYLWDMVEASRAVQRFVAAAERAQYLRDRPFLTCPLFDLA